VSVAPPLVPGESEAKYASLAARVVAAEKPEDAIEEILTQDFIDDTWDIERLRRFKVGILKASIIEGIQTVMNRLGCHSIGSKKWAAGDKGAKKEVERALTAAGLSIDEVTATTFERKIETFAQIDHMLASAEARRNGARREIDRHRSVRSAAVRYTLDGVEAVGNSETLKAAKSLEQRGDDEQTTTAGQQIQR
jgi:hypothetical protein